MKQDLNGKIRDFVFNIYAQLPLGAVSIKKDIFFYHSFLFITYRGFIRYNLDKRKSK